MISIKKIHYKPLKQYLCNCNDNSERDFSNYYSHDTKDDDNHVVEDRYKDTDINQAKDDNNSDDDADDNNNNMTNNNNTKKSKIVITNNTTNND